MSSGSIKPNLLRKTMSHAEMIQVFAQVGFCVDPRAARYARVSIAARKVGFKEPGLVL